MRHVIVTGGSRGLGAALIVSLLEAGFKVSACSRSRTELIDRLLTERKHSNDFFWAECQIDDADSASVFVDKAVDWAGSDGLYGLVNNAGVAGEGILATFPSIDMQRIIGVNLLGSLYMSRAALRHLLRSGHGGRIINISSIIGSRGYSGLAAYSASKAGIDGLTRALAREMGRRGITCNSIAPGYMLTDMSSSLNPMQLAQIVNRTPLKRLGEPKDVTEAIKFLLSDGASFITGQILIIDGGITC